MIVKNEAHVIRRCLDSVRPLIDHWVIVDTGSTDGTQALIRELMTGLPGELHERPWVDFSHNRNQALDFARARMAKEPCSRSYALMIDADETLVFEAGFECPPLTADAYEVSVHHDALRYARNCVVALDMPWRYEGVLHEALACPMAHRIERIDGIHVFYRAEGARSQNPRKYHDDAAVLEKALREDPDNSRYLFYLGQSYRDAGEAEQALSAYQRRATLPGWAEETWYSLFQIARLMEALGRPDADIAHAYALAYQYRPARSEPLVELARFHRQRGQFALAMLYARQAAQIPQPSDRLFVDESCYRWRALDELAIAAYYTGDTSEGRATSQRLLAESYFPAEEAERIKKNAAFYAERGD